MDLYLEEAEETVDPLDIVEAVIDSDERFAAERGDEGDLHFTLTSAWARAAGYFSHREELPALLFTLGFDLRVPEDRRAEAAKLAALINEHLWIGHFDIWSDDGSIVFRHALPMIGREEVSPGEVQALLAAALDAADRFHPAFQFLLQAGATPEDAARAAMFEIAGEA